MGMRFSTGRRNREGPGTPAPQSGAALYFYLLGTYFWRFFWLGWLFLVCCIPIVTIPAALTALDRVMVKLIRERCVLFWAEYWTEFRRSFVKSLPLGVLFGGLLLISYYLLSLGLTNQQNSFGLLFSGIGLCVLVIGSTWGAYAFVMLAALELPVGTLLRNAWYLMVLSGRYTFAVMATLVFSTVILLALFPMSLALVAFGWLAVTQYTVCWFVYQPVEDRIIRPFEKQNAEREEETV